MPTEFKSRPQDALKSLCLGSEATLYTKRLYYEMTQDSIFGAQYDTQRLF